MVGKIVECFELNKSIIFLCTQLSSKNFELLINESEKILTESERLRRLDLDRLRRSRDLGRLELKDYGKY